MTTPRYFAVTLVALCSACAAPLLRPQIAMPAAYDNASASDRAAADGNVSEAWWDQLDDPALSALIDLMRTENLDLQTAGARVAQARALAAQARSLRYPQVLLQGGGSYAHTTSAVFGDSDTLGASASVPVSYEIDWLQARGRDARAADLDGDAGALDLEAATITLAAQVAESYFALREAQARAGLLEAYVASNQTFLELIELRYQEGLNSAVDVLQQRQLVLSTQSQLTTARAGIRMAEQALAALLGPEALAPLREVAAGALPAPPAVPNAGVPEALLQNRPDLRAAHRRVRAADLRVGTAVAARLPSFFLSGTLGYSYSRTEGQTYGATDANMDGVPDGFGLVERTSTNDGFNWNAGVQLQWSLFDGGRGRATVNLREAQLREAVLAYASKTRGAIAEVETALAREVGTRERFSATEEQTELSRQTVRSARDRFREGLIEYLQVLSATTSMQQAELNLLSLRRQLLSDRIQLYRALGGAWSGDLAPSVTENDS